MSNVYTALSQALYFSANFISSSTYKGRTENAGKASATAIATLCPAPPKPRFLCDFSPTGGGAGGEGRPLSDLVSAYTRYADLVACVFPERRLMVMIVNALCR